MAACSTTSLRSCTLPINPTGPTRQKPASMPEVPAVIVIIIIIIIIINNIISYINVIIYVIIVYFFIIIIIVISSFCFIIIFFFIISLFIYHAPHSASQTDPGRRPTAAQLLQHPLVAAARLPPDLPHLVADAAALSARAGAHSSPQVSGCRPHLPAARPCAELVHARPQEAPVPSGGRRPSPPCRCCATGQPTAMPAKAAAAAASSTAANASRRIPGAAMARQLPRPAASDP